MAGAPGCTGWSGSTIRPSSSSLPAPSRRVRDWSSRSSSGTPSASRTPDASFDLADFGVRRRTVGRSLLVDSGGGPAAPTRRQARVSHERPAYATLRARSTWPTIRRRTSSSGRSLACTGRSGPTTPRSNSTSRTANGSRCCANSGFEIERLIEIQAPADAQPSKKYSFVTAGLGPPVAIRGGLERPQARLSRADNAKTEQSSRTDPTMVSAAFRSPSFGATCECSAISWSGRRAATSTPIPP